ncbi:MAG: hypothetical protein HW403_602 [Dehalococcoidia bacterium]|nr:hypothetical protein [Dehalococcoidia bacterium]
MTQATERSGRGWSRGRLALIAFLAIAGFLLLTEHTAHVFGALPFLLLLACPVLHIFMHGGHGNGGEGHDAHPREYNS